MKQKRHQRNPDYYYFWVNFMVLTVFLGQLYVGYGYRLMHGSMQDLMNKVDGVLLHKEGYSLWRFAVSFMPMKLTG